MISNIVKSLRKNAGLTQKQASELMNIDISTWERYEAGVTCPKIHFIELFCIKTNQDFKEYKEIINDYIDLNKYLNDLKLEDEKLKLVKKLSDDITKDILSENEERRYNSEFCKLEHHDGQIKITRWGDISSFSRTKCDANIKTWYNKLLNEAEIKLQVIKFLSECENKKLELKY